MKAAVLHEPRTPFAIEDVPVPDPGPGDVILRVEACGVCHSDLHLAEGDWPQLSRIVKLPLILGHEVVGRVVRLGSGVRDRRLDERLGVAWIHWACGDCDHCREGNENRCHSQSITGATVDGGFAEFMRAKASHALPVPDTLSSAEAAPLFCAGVTVYRAIRRAGIRGGERVALFGIGGLGHLALQILRAFEADVVAVDVSEAKLALAKELGAAETVNARGEDVRRALRSLGGAHHALVTSAAREAYETALGSLRRGGQLLLVGVPAEDLCVSPIMMVGGETRIMASAVGTRRDVAETLQLAAEGRLRCRIQTRSLDDVEAVFEDMRRGRIDGRAVLMFE